MQPFRFRLERALDWYRHQCALEESRLASCLRARDAVQEVLARLQAERETVDREMIARPSSMAREWAALGLYRLHARHRAAQLENDLQIREAGVRDQRRQVQVARRRVQLVEKLRERRFAEHAQAESRELENLGTELFLARWTAGGTT